MFIILRVCAAQEGFIFIFTALSFAVYKHVGFKHYKNTKNTPNKKPDAFKSTIESLVDSIHTAGMNVRLSAYTRLSEF